MSAPGFHAANAQPVLVIYKSNEASGVYNGYGIQVITLIGAQISDIITFRNPALRPASRHRGVIAVWHGMERRSVQWIRKLLF